MWDVFLSYSARDATAVGRVQRFLERYRLPDGRRLRVYRDETDIAGGELPEQLQQALAESGCLVVGCSDAAAASEWVAREIDAFRTLAPGRPILPLLVADDPPANLPVPVRAVELRWSDIRKGWRLGLPRRETRTELVRLVAAAAGMEFRELLPLDRQRRRRAALRATAAIALVAMGLAWLPVLDWVEATPEGRPIFGCDTLDDGVALFEMNEPQAIKNIVHVQRGVLGPTPRGEVLEPDLIPRGRLLPAPIARGIRERCGGSVPGWIGEPEPGVCVGVRESDTLESFSDHMGGGEAALTDVLVGDETFVLSQFWRRIGREDWEGYGRTVHPSRGLPVSAKGGSLWLGFPDDQMTRGKLWHTGDGGRSWDVVPGITDVRSVRQLTIGVLLAARLDRELGFYLYRGGRFEPFAVPGKGDDIEVCGEVDGQPVVRADRNVYRRARQPWWRTRLDRGW